ncbi:importin subunit alpha, putative [Entamoeba invadens IP1]|uniref:Importin subunit alpha, putative n=1 Tax=Entamoeba invadens IP1 TaxID=370355 RepID=A0A0A1U5U0_ENTIV|nr:importin subunit alpha, putative [Entamoeba invadens IP1]ELP88235.1 importin subunit alpha, putative [Entamoeba invadens IP1]|eukprot:XP_004255006.1 importin subunit alpha, putative [Entamoeba invadens IP1]
MSYRKEKTFSSLCAEHQASHNTLRTSVREEFFASKRQIEGEFIPVVVVPNEAGLREVIAQIKLCDVQAMSTYSSYFSETNMLPFNLLIELNAFEPLFNRAINNNDDTFNEKFMMFTTNFLVNNQSDIFGRQLINMGFIKVVDKLLDSTSQTVVLRCLTTVSNSLANSASNSDAYIRFGIFERAMSVIQKYKTFETLQTITWLFSNICRTRLTTDFTEMTKIADFFLSILVDFDKYSDQIVSDALWGVGYLAQTRHYESFVTSKELLDTIFQILRHGQYTNLTLRFLGNYASRNGHEIDLIVDANVFSLIENAVMTTTKSSTIKEAYWVLSNIIGGENATYCKTLVTTTQLIQAAVEAIMQTKFDNKVLDEMEFVVSNLLYIYDDELIAYILSRCLDVIRVYIIILQTSRNTQLISSTLQAVFNVLTFGQKNGTDLVDVFVALGLPDVLESIAIYCTDRTKKLVRGLKKQFFPEGSEATSLTDL